MDHYAGEVEAKLGPKPQRSAFRSASVKVDPSANALLQTPVRAVFSELGFI